MIQATYYIPLALYITNPDLTIVPTDLVHNSQSTVFEDPGSSHRMSVHNSQQNKRTIQRHMNQVELHKSKLASLQTQNGNSCK